MEVSPSAPKLYRTGRRAVTFAVLAVLLTGIAIAQTGSKPSAKKSRGPRAIGLLELAPNGKGHLVPITILIDGQYYDAAAYKANPVPMALESGTVYEAISTGVSQGLFTVAGAVQANQAWLGEGTWQAAGSAPAPKKVDAPKHPSDEDIGGPPVLRRSGTTPAKAPEPPPAETKPAETKPDESKPTAAEPEKKAEATPAPAPAEAAPLEDPDRPTLHRGKPEDTEKKPSAPEPVAQKPVVAKPVAPASLKPIAPPGIKVVPAISDANVQESRSFAFQMKPEEEEQFRKQMLAMAAEEVNARVKSLEPSAGEASSPRRAGTSKASVTPPAPAFENVQMRVFDLTSSNEPVLVLSATAHPKLPKGKADIPYFVTLIARNNIYAELKKVEANITDSQHVDVVPQLELIDAIDADGDGHGELLFRRSSDTGSAYAIYRVIGTQLYPLFEGKIS
jgi:hypothetical protein